jgi:hypothetical protein
MVPRYVTEDVPEFQLRIGDSPDIRHRTPAHPERQPAKAARFFCHVFLMIHFGIHMETWVSPHFNFIRFMLFS